MRKYSPSEKELTVYETEMTGTGRVVCDLCLNIGWMVYFVTLMLIFVKRSDLISYPVIFGMLIASAFPAVVMLLGLAELISERILGLVKELPRGRLVRGYGLLIWAGAGGSAVSAAAAVYGLLATQAGLGYVFAMLFGAVMCALSAWIVFRGYSERKKSGAEAAEKKEEDNDIQP